MKDSEAALGLLFLAVLLAFILSLYGLISDSFDIDALDSIE